MSSPMYIIFFSKPILLNRCGAELDMQIGFVHDQNMHTPATEIKATHIASSMRFGQHVLRITNERREKDEESEKIQQRARKSELTGGRQATVLLNTIQYCANRHTVDMMKGEVLRKVSRSLFPKAMLYLTGTTDLSRAAAL